jgi:hypothetical protein
MSSAFLPSSDIARRSRHFAFVPNAEIKDEEISFNFKYLDQRHICEDPFIRAS